VQLSLPWTEPVREPPAPVVFVRHRRARRYILRVMTDGTLRVTLPKWGVKHEAHAFIQASHAWIARQRALHRQRPPAPAPWGDGTRFLLDGHEAIVRIDTDRSRLTISSSESVIVTLAAENRGEIRATVEAWLRDRARRELPILLLTLADAHGIAVRRVSVRNQRARWGACSTSGTITLNWRLIQAPLFVREYVLLHELMHRREMNHSRRFWRLVAACCPRHAEARQWLRREGKALWSD
jgi:predicted metal-dependent hydrolase